MGLIFNMDFVLQNVDILKDAETVRQLGSILKTNVRACKAVGHPFVVQLGRIYLDMLNVYKCLSENISSAVQSNGKFLSSPWICYLNQSNVRGLSVKASDLFDHIKVHSITGVTT